MVLSFRSVIAFLSVLGALSVPRLSPGQITPELIEAAKKEGEVMKQQWPLTVYDEDGTLLGDYLADLLVEGVLVLVRMVRR